MLGQCATAALVFAAGCPGDDSGEGTAAESGGMPTTGGTSPATSDSDSDPSETGAPTQSGTGSDGGSSSGSTGEPQDGSSSGSGPGDSTTGSASACEGMVVAAISNNHGHTLEIPLADIEAGIEVTYDASGDSGHCHEVILTAEDFATLRDGGVVTKYSCNGGDHQYVLSCAPGAPDPVLPPECSDGDDTGQCG